MEFPANISFSGVRRPNKLMHTVSQKSAAAEITLGPSISRPHVRRFFYFHSAQIRCFRRVLCSFAAPVRGESDCGPGVRHQCKFWKNEFSQRTRPLTNPRSPDEFVCFWRMKLCHFESQLVCVLANDAQMDLHLCVLGYSRRVRQLILAPCFGAFA